MSSSESIGQCSICLSNLTSSNIYTISKCGHTFHQMCIDKWITASKNCPSCRTRASKTDVIKLFIEESTDEAEVKTEMDESFIEYRYPDYNHRKMNKCECELFYNKSGDLEYRCLIDFNVIIRSYKKWTDGQITEIRFDGYLITVFQSTKLEIFRQQTNEKSIVTSDGKRYEYFNVLNESQQNINIIFNSKQGIHRFANGIEQPLTELNTVRSDNDFVKQDENRIKFSFDGFTVKRT